MTCLEVESCVKLNKRDVGEVYEVIVACGRGDEVTLV